MQKLKHYPPFLVDMCCSLVLASCQSATTEQSPLPGAGSAHAITLADADEPGERLTLFGLVVDAESNEPIPDARVYLYHADANGEYLRINRSGLCLIDRWIQLN